MATLLGATGGDALVRATSACASALKCLAATLQTAEVLIGRNASAARYETTRAGTAHGRLGKTSSLLASLAGAALRAALTTVT